MLKSNLCLEEMIKRLFRNVIPLGLLERLIGVYERTKLVDQRRRWAPKISVYQHKSRISNCSGCCNGFAAVYHFGNVRFLHKLEFSARPHPPEIERLARQTLWRLVIVISVNSKIAVGLRVEEKAIPVQALV